MTTPSETSLSPAMTMRGGPEWPGAVWIGEIDRTSDLLDRESITLDFGAGFQSCRLLIRDGGRALGFVELPVVDSQVSTAEAQTRIAQLTSRPAPDSPADPPAVTVTVSTRNRPDQLSAALDSLLQLDYHQLQILIVDNASSGPETRQVVESRGDERLRYVYEERIGLSYGRNRALVEATTPIVAFTDDDVVVDRHWVAAIAEAFTSADDIALVTGIVPTGELRTPSQAYFERETHWQQRLEPRTFRRAEPPPDIRAFPLDVGRYGTGANFAVDREIVVRLGGFDEALGIGSPTHGGEDLDMFLRVLYGGWALAYTPDAIVWHRHREDTADLEKAVQGYGTSWGAWLWSLVDNPTTRRDALQVGSAHLTRRLSELAHRRPARQTDADTFDLEAFGFAHLPALSKRSLLDGPLAYRRSRASGRRARPLYDRAS
jgi:GT2 family glycosyltransferase